MTTHPATVEGLPLHVRSEGSGDPIVLVHGLFGASADWDAVAADLEKDHRVVRLDLRGHGASGTPSADYALTDHQADLLAAMDAAGVDNAVLIGHDIGGMAALQVAVHHPARVSGLVVFNTTSEAEEAPLPWRIDGRLAKHLGVKQASARLAGRMFGKTAQQVRGAVVSQWRSRLEGLDKDQVHRALRAWVRRPSFERSLDKVGCYALSVAGAEDAVISPDNAKRVQEAIPGAKHKIVQSAGHQLPLEKPEAAVEWIRWSLDEMLQGPRDLRTGFRHKK